MKIIVCGSIGYGGIEDIRSMQGFLIENGFDIIDHISEKDMDYSHINDFRDEPELTKKIVEHDLMYIEQCDAIVVILNKPSIGTTIEMIHARNNGKKIYLLAKDKVPTPWPIYYSDFVVKSEEELLEQLNL